MCRSDNHASDGPDTLCDQGTQVFICCVIAYQLGNGIRKLKPRPTVRIQPVCLVSCDDSCTDSFQPLLVGDLRNGDNN